MHRTKPGGGWTLLYAKQGGASLALAQVELQADTDLDHLRARLLPEVIEAMRRRAPWQLALHHGDTDAPWEDHAAAERHLRAVEAWVALQRGLGLAAEEALRGLYPRTLGDTCACLLLSGSPAPDPGRIDLRALWAALEAWRQAGARPSALTALTKGP